jgi:hypothetical protein
MTDPRAALAAADGTAYAAWSKWQSWLPSVSGAAQGYP